MTTIVMSVEGVLTHGSTDTHALNYEASVQGRVLYHALRDSTRLVLLSHDPSKDRVKSWLARERLTRYADVQCRPHDSALTPSEWRIWRLKELISAGHHISFFIDSDPATVSAALETGVGALLVVNSSVIPGEETPRYAPWYDLVATIERQSLLRASRSVEEDSDG